MQEEQSQLYNWLSRMLMVTYLMQPIRMHTAYKEAVSKTLQDLEHVAKCGANKPHANITVLKE
jgi:hypothetical protein